MNKECKIVEVVNNSNGQNTEYHEKRKSTKKLTKEIFIERAIEIHGLKYDYSKVEYTNNRDKVEIICPTHGSFLQSPNKHLSGQGCKQCSIIEKGTKHTLTTKEFIERAKKVHGDKYDYSVSKYIQGNKKVEIVCKIHGSFWQYPHLHWGGSGCPKCSHIEGGLKGRIKIDELLKRFRKIHGNKYDYSKVEYKTNSVPIEIICKEHSSFFQIPTVHLNGGNCPKCSAIELSLNSRKPFDDFVSEANKVHHNKYIYDECSYVNRRVKMKIHCPIHGVFKQSPRNHILGQGCPKCGYIGNRKLVFGIGINDIGSCDGNGKITESYLSWVSMLRRCYSNVFNDRWTTYKKCSVCNEWLTYSSFKKWFDENHINGFALDKDLKQFGLEYKVYSPETCVFIPSELNTLIAVKSKNPHGVVKYNYGFIAQIVIDGNRHRVGPFDTFEKANSKYIEMLNTHIVNVAYKYYNRGELTSDVMDIIYKITDKHKNL